MSSNPERNTERNPALHNNLEHWRIYIAIGAIALVFIGFIVQLFNLQVVQGPDYVAAAENNRTQEINIPAPRGIILDRNGTVLASNIASYNVVITPADLPDDEGSIQEVYRSLSRLIDVPVNLNEITPENPYVPCTSEHGIAQIANFGETTAPFSPVRIKCNIDEQLAKVLMEKAVDLPGVSVEVEPVRDYPTGDLTANVIGYLGPIPAEFEDIYKEQGLVSNRDKVGYAGVELSLEDYLLGQNGLRTVEKDVGGQVLRDLLPPQPAVPGDNIQLTLDTRLQKAAQTILIQEIDALNRISSTGVRATSGVVIAMNPKTGEILAMVSWPSYENNRMARIIPAYYMEQLQDDGREPLLNHAVQAERPSGSVFKLVTATGALNEHVVTVDQVIDAPGQITLTEKYYANDPGRAKNFVDWNRDQGGFGKITFVECIANSSNVCFYKLGGGYQDEIPEGLGVCRLGAYARALGYGAPSGIELPGEENGLIPDPTWKRINQGENWSTGDTYLASVGQGYVLATPIQVLMSAATMANNGKLMQPTILREVLDGEGNVIKPFEPREKWDVTTDPVVEEMAPTQSVGSSCRPTGNYKTVDPYVIQKVREGMRGAVTHGTLADIFAGVDIPAAGKTGTAEYCDNIAQSKNLCQPGNWPTHAWTVAFAPFEDPEIAVVAFVYNGGEGATIAGPIVKNVIQYYFQLKAIDTAAGNP
jgi:penicillin-binding protein 2